MKRGYFILLLLLVVVQNKKEDPWSVLIRNSKKWYKKNLSKSKGLIDEIRVTKRWIKKAKKYYK
jgi:hypothetical protein